MPQIFATVIAGMVDSKSDSARSWQQYQNQEEHALYDVNFALDVTNLVASASLILHDFSIIASVHDHAYNLLRVLQHSLS